MLEKYQLPATFYITTGGIGTSDQFWWDELQDLILLNEILPKEFKLTINNETFNFDLGDECQLNQTIKNQIKNWNAEQAPVNKRTNLYFSLWEILQSSEPALRKKSLHNIHQWAGQQSEHSGKMMDWDQVRSISNKKLFSVGAHTINHPALGMQPKEIQIKEIVDGRNNLSQMINKDVSGFAYPHGNYNQETISILQNASFKYAVTTEPTTVLVDSKIFELPRFQVKNWNEKIFSQNFHQWLSSKS